MLPRYAEVVVPRHLHRSFTYIVPDALRSSLCVGDPVLVPFGPVTVRGMVVALGGKLELPTAPSKLRAVLSISREAPRSPVDGLLLELSRWIAGHYLAPLGQCLRLILSPTGAQGKVERYQISAKGRQILSDGSHLSGLDRLILQFLAKRPTGLSLKLLRKQVPDATQALLTHVLERGWVMLASTAGGQSLGTVPVPFDTMPHLGRERPQSSDTQWCSLVHRGVATSQFAPMLLETSSDRRLEAVLAAAAVTVAAQRRVIILAPEVRRVSAIATEARRYWGAAVEEWHSEKPEADRAASWRRIRAGDVKIVVGTRTAVLVPLERVGLICVDGEDHGSFKEEQEPRFHARDVAWRRAELEHALLLLLSSHASLETRYRVERHASRLQPGDQPRTPVVPIEVVPLQYPPRENALSSTLRQAVEQTLAAGHRVALYLNRRGYAPALVCTVCRAVPRCPRCQIALTYSQETRRVRCRACGHHAAAPDHCPSCKGTHFDLIGYGTERLEAEITELFPRARVMRLDRDTTSRTKHGGIDLQRDLAGGWNIVIGTKLMLGALPERSCGLVGIPYAEAGLHLPDFRASERTYHELLDVVNLVDPAVGGRAILQTCLPAHPVIRALTTGDREPLDRDESALRQALEYPPFASLVALQAVGKDEADVRTMIGQWAGLLQEGSGKVESRTRGGPPSTILGPVPGLRARGRSNWRLVVKGRDGDEVRALVRKSVEQLADQAGSRGVKLYVDVDPLELA